MKFINFKISHKTIPVLNYGSCTLKLNFHHSPSNRKVSRVGCDGVKETDAGVGVHCASRSNVSF